MAADDDDVDDAPRHFYVSLTLFHLQRTICSRLCTLFSLSLSFFVFIDVAAAVAHLRTCGLERSLKFWHNLRFDELFIISLSVLTHGRALTIPFVEFFNRILWLFASKNTNLQFEEWKPHTPTRRTATQNNAIRIVSTGVFFPRSTLYSQAFIVRNARKWRPLYRDQNETIRNHQQIGIPLWSLCAFTVMSGCGRQSLRPQHRRPLQWIRLLPFPHSFVERFNVQQFLRFAPLTRTHFLSQAL